MKFLLVQKGNTKKKREQITSHIKTYYSSAFDDYLFFMQRANIILQFNIVQSSNTQWRINFQAKNPSESHYSLKNPTAHAWRLSKYLDNELLKTLTQSN